MAVNETTSRLIMDGNPDGLVAAMQKSVTSVKDGTGQMVSHFNQIGGSINSVIGIVGTLGGVIAGGAAFKSIVSQSASWNLESAKLAKTLGDTTENASILKVQLQHLGIDQDLVSTASLRMANTMRTNSDAFKALGVDVEAMQKSGKSNIDIMMATVQALGEYKGGLDRNQMAMSIFSRSWGELQALMKLSPEGFRQAEERARQLHLIVGPEGVEQSKKYKEGLRDVDLVGQALAINLGNVLIPQLVNLGSALNEKLPGAASVLISHLHDVEAEIIRMAMLADKAGGTLTTLGYAASKVAYAGTKFFTIGNFGDNFDKDAKRFNELNEMYRKRYQEGEKSLQRLANLEVGLDENGNPIKPSSAGHGGKSAPPKPPAAPSGPDPSEQLYKRYGTELNTLNRQIAESNPYLNEQEKAMAAVYATVLKLSEEMPEYTRSWNAYGASMEQNILLAKKLKDEQEQLQIGKEMEMDELVNGLMKSDAWLNAVGKISESQQARLDDSAMLSDWAARREASRQAELAAQRQFYSLTDQSADQELQQTLTRIEQEQEAWMQSWAMQTDSFEEYERRKTLIQNYYEQQRTKANHDAESRRLGIAAATFGNMATIADAFYQLSGRQSKAALKAYQVTKSGETVITTADTAMKAYDAMASIPYVGPALGAIAAGAAIATGAVQLQNIWSVGSDGSGGTISTGGLSASGGYSSGYASDRTIAQPVSQAASQGLNLKLTLVNPIGNKKWFEDNLPEIMRDMASRNVNMGVVYQ